MRSLEFYQERLDRVSRSFAFCIPQLDLPLRGWVALSYLLCRVLDTIEDTRWEDAGAQSRMYDRFETFLASPPSRAEVDEWALRFPRSIPDGERFLLSDAGFLFEDMHELPLNVRENIRDTVLRMSGGMRHYAALQQESRVLRLGDLQEVNRYCYFVAGIVGELLTRLLIEHRQGFTSVEGLLKNAYHFGLFLQKVNLLKDQRQDEKEGRFLVPDRCRVLASLRENGRGALLYLASLPRDERGYRTFCAWSLFLGFASLPWIGRSAAEGAELKIPREATQALLAEVAAIAQDDAALLARGAAELAKLPEPPDDSWFHRLSGGVLTPSELEELGIRDRSGARGPAPFQGRGEIPRAPEEAPDVGRAREQAS